MYINESHNLKISIFLLHGYHTPQLQNSIHPAVALSQHNFKILPTAIWNFFRLAISLILLREFFFLCVSYITIVSNITILCHTMLFFHWIFLPSSHCVNKKAPLSASPHLPPSSFINILLLWSDHFFLSLFLKSFLLLL